MAAKFKNVDFKKLIIPFLTGGTIVAGVKLVAGIMDNPRLAAMLGGFPLGLFSIYFLADSHGKAYGFDYFVITSILLASVLVFNFLLRELGWSKNDALLGSLVTWFSLALLRYIS